MRVVLQPAGSEDASKHYVDTIENRVAVGRILSKLGPVDRSWLTEKIGSQQSLPVWGVTPGKNDVNKRKWEKIARGDIALFAKAGGIFASAVVVAKLQSRDLALDLWQENSDGETWEFVYFLDEVHPQNIPYEAMNVVLGYKLNKIVQGFSVLDEDKSDALIQHFDLESQTYWSPSDDADVVAAIDALDQMDDFDWKLTVKTRREQRFLRSALFGDALTGHCCVCGEEFPVDLLVAAHVKKRSHCTHEERKDYKNVVVPMCKLGCDDLFERGYLIVDSDGFVRALDTPVQTAVVQRYSSASASKRCLGWRPGNSEYFAWHARYWSDR